MENKLLQVTAFQFACRRSFLLFALMLSTIWASAKPIPTAYFTVSPTTGCAPLLVQCFNASGAGSYQWTFGDSASGSRDSSTACSPSHVYNSPGTYTITLVVSGLYTHTEIVNVLGSPTPHITGVIGVCAGATQTYSVLFTPGNTYAWTVTGGVYATTGAGNIINVTWLSAGTGDITVVETNPSGCSSTNTIHVAISARPDVSSHMPCGKRADIETNAGTKTIPLDSGSTVSCICPNSISTYGMPSDGNTYYWYATNGTVISVGPRGETATVKWGHSGTATLTVVEISPYGCKDSATCTFTICPGPTASLSAGTVCNGTPTTFTDLSVGTPFISAYLWDFGDGTTSTASNPSHTYASPGTYTVTLTVTDGKGCTDDSAITVIVTPGSGPKIVCISSVCAYASANYSTLSIAGATYTWSVTGAVSYTPSGNTLSVNWGAGPVGTITLTVSGTSYYTCGMPTTVTVPILPAVPPIIGSTIVCVGPSYTYTAPLVPGSDYTWTVSGAVSYSSIGNVLTVIWDASATGTITVKMRNEILCCEGTNTITISKKPNLNITGFLTACAGSGPFTYSLPVGIVGDWTVTGGTITSGATGVNSITVTWGSAGTGLVTANVITTAYCNSTATISVNIVPPPAAVSITGPNPVCYPSGISTYTTTVASGIVSSTWSLPAGGIITAQTSTSCDVSWLGPGTFVLVLKQINSAGCFTITNYTVTVVDHSIPAITGLTTACVNDLRSYSFVSPFPPSTYTWSITGGNLLSGLGTNNIIVKWGYSAPGTVTLTNNVCGGSVSLTVIIMDSPAVYVDTIGLNCFGPGADLRAHTAATNTILWSTGSTTSIAGITGPGVYTVTVTNASGCTRTLTINLTSWPTLPHPVAVITKTVLGPSPGPVLVRFCVPDVLGNTYHWSSGETTPCIEVGIGDSIPRTVVVTNSFGCKDTAIDSNIIPHIPPCIGCPPPCMTWSCPDAFGVITVSAAPGGSGYSWSDGTTGTSTTFSSGTISVTYTDALGNPQSCSYTYPGVAVSTFTHTTCNSIIFNSTGSVANYYYWNFGDGTHSTDASPTHEYLPGTYTAKLSCSLDGICWVSSTATFTVTSIIHPDFTWTPGCNLFVSFTNTSTIVGGPVVFNWNFDDPASLGANTSGLPNPTHLFTVGGVHHVRLKISVGGCSKIIVYDVIPPELDPIFGTCGLGCLNESVEAVDATVHTSPIVSWFWDFGNGNTSTLQNPWNIYTLVGTYTVTLTVTDSRGCVNTRSVPITVSAFPTVSIVVGGATVFCSGDSVLLSGSLPGYDYIWTDGETTQNIYAKVSGDYSLTFIDPLSGCKKTVGPIHVIVNPRPHAIITASGPLTICEGSLLKLSAPTGSGFTYKWYKNGVQLVLPSTQDNYSISNTTQAGVYTVVISNGFGCKDSSAPDTVIVNGAPYLYITGTPWICGHGSTTLLANVAVGGPVTYLWNTGATTASISVSIPGVYTVTGTNSSGCTSTATVTVFRPAPADFDLLPKGCYSMCASASATLTLGSGFSYTWYNGSTVAGTGTSYTISSAGNYWVVATSPYGCKDTSDTFNVTIVPGPSVSISASGPLVLCTGTSGSLTLTATGSTGVTYLWNTGATTSSITVTTPGLYTVTVRTNACCFATDSVRVDSANCCFPPGDIFTTVPDSTVISADQVWDGKYYVAGKVHVTGNATLDLSVVDIIFAPTGEIIFHDSTTIRANNSVLRPCKIDGIWVGLTFLDKSHGLIHTCTFKNADVAVNANSTYNTSVKLVDNTFSQCHTSIYINKYTGTYTEGITGNSMVIDDTYLPFSSNDYFGIKLYNTTMEEVISQNSFRNATKVGQYKNFYGIFSVSSSTTVSTNTFTNMHRSVDLESPVSYFSIENNTIEITQSSTPNDYQIRIDNSDVPVIVFNNMIWNSLPNPANTAAIYGASSSLLNINQNQIKGYSVGVQLEQVTKTQVLENNITNTKLVGIYLNDGDGESSCDVDIACNEIDMDLVPQVDSTATPIGIETYNADKSAQIRGNCISNTSIAIYVYSVAGEVIPVIRNNFMYSYIYAGVYDDGHPGDIGTAGPPFSKAGRNTFASNNVTAYDVTSTGASLTEAGNYGVVLTNIYVSSAGTPNLYSSTASCAKQINTAGPSDVTIDDIAICDHFDELLYPYLEQVSPGDFELAPKFVSHLSSLSGNPGAFDEVSSLLSTVAAKDNMDAATLLYTEVSHANILSGNAAQWFEYKYAYLSGNFSKAQGIVNSINPLLADEADLKKIETIRVAQQLQAGKVRTLSAANISTLATVDERRGKYAAAARDMLQMDQAQHDYIFNRLNIPAVKLPKASATNRATEYMEVFPNPASERITVRYNIKNAQNHNLRVVDVLGQEVKDVPLIYNASEFQLDISHLSDGVYVIFLMDGKEQHRARFVKN